MKRSRIIFPSVLFLIVFLGSLSIVLIPTQASPEKILEVSADNNQYFGQNFQTPIEFNATLSQSAIGNKIIQVELSTDPPTPKPGNQTQIQIIFMNKDMNSTQKHVDYKVSILKGDNQVFSIILSHSTDGLANFPYTFQEVGTYQIIIEVDDVLFLPIPPETTTFPIVVEGLQNTNQTVLASAKTYHISITSGSGLSQNCVLTHDCFYPHLIKIIPESTIIWTNNDSIAHTVTSGNTSDIQTGNIFSSSMIPPGKTFSFTFYNTNDYSYFDQVHPWMTGQIIVENSTSTLPKTTVPEFPLALPILLTSFISLVAFYKIKLSMT